MMRGGIVAAAAALALLSAACGADQPSLPLETGDTTTTYADPAPTVEDCPNFVTEVVTDGEPEDASEFGPVATTQQRLMPDVEAAMAYGQAHPDEFGSVRFANTPYVRIVVGFTDHLEEHCAALRSLLAHPDEFELVRDPATGGDLLGIMDAIAAMGDDRIRGMGTGADTVHVQLRADGEDLAAEIAARYGDLVEISVGAFPWPDPAAGVEEGPGSCAAALPPPPTVPSSLVVTLDPVGEVPSGHDFATSVTVTNAGAEAVAFESGSPLIALVVVPGTDDVIGIYTGGIAGVGVGANLASGESIDIEVIGGTASCDPSLGYAVPPGDYEVFVAVDQYEYPGGEFELHAIVSDRVPLTITP